jgi:hypothetical protein
VGITFTPIVRIKLLLAVSSIPGIFDKVERWVKDLDRVREGTQLLPSSVTSRAGEPRTLAEVLKQVYVPVKGAKPEGRKEAITPPRGPSGSVPGSQARRHDAFHSCGCRSAGGKAGGS